MYSAEKSFQNKSCFKIVDEEVKKLLDQNFAIKVPPELIDHGKPKWYLKLQAIFTPERTTQVRLVFDSVQKATMVYPLTIFSRKVLISSIVSSICLKHGNNIAQIKIITGSCGKVRKVAVYQWLRLDFGDKPASDIATNASNTLANLSQAVFPEATRELQDHLHLDDIGGPEQLLRKRSRLRTRLKLSSRKISFHIEFWHSNQAQIDQSNGEHLTDLLSLR